MIRQPLPTHKRVIVKETFIDDGSGNFMAVVHDIMSNREQYMPMSSPSGANFPQAGDIWTVSSDQGYMRFVECERPFYKPVEQTTISEVLSKLTERGVIHYQPWETDPASTSFVEAAYLAGVGEIRMYPTGCQPPNWLPTNGQAIDINRYRLLYSVIGSRFGESGSTFNVPLVNAGTMGQADYYVCAE